MSLVFCIISILQEFPYFASAISLDFAGFFRFFPLLFTHACPATEFCRCFAFQIGKISENSYPYTVTFFRGFPSCGTAFPQNHLFQGVF